jgi:hypothetical protein
MTEDFLHYIWKFRLFNSQGLNAHTGEPIEILKPGLHNHGQGPDFFDAVLKIGDTTWAGNVELHLNASDWDRHNHTTDKAYDNVVLHVVYQNDKVIRRASGEEIPALELKDRIGPEIISRYLSLYDNIKKIPCAERIKEVDSFIIENWLNRLLFERLEKKSAVIEAMLSKEVNDWQEIFYRRLAYNFGFKVNAEPFELLAKSLPLQYLLKHQDSLLQLEALLFGQAGLLEKGFYSDYPLLLQREYRILQSKFSLKPLDAHLWKFMRLRPKNFPTIRLSQFAMLLHRAQKLFSKVLEEENPTAFFKLFNTSVSEYWESHYVFEKESEPLKKALGRASIENIIINTVVPFLFVYGRQKREDKFKEKALKLLESIQPEKNVIIEDWENTGMAVKNAFESQAFIELKTSYCDKKQCLNCAIGNKLLKS